MESAKPEKAQAQQFAEGVLAVHPQKLLTYNLSPSFNWDATGMTDEEIRSVPATMAVLYSLFSKGEVGRGDFLVRFHCRERNGRMFQWEPPSVSLDQRKGVFW
jgi:hypothetical protein